MRKIGYDVPYEDIFALTSNDHRQSLSGIVTLSNKDNPTYAEQVAALISDRQATEKMGVQPDGYIDRLLTQIAKEGNIKLPDYVDKSRPSVFDLDDPSRQKSANMEATAASVKDRELNSYAAGRAGIASPANTPPIDLKIEGAAKSMRM